MIRKIKILHIHLQMRKMLSPRKKGGSTGAASSDVGVNSVTTKIENVDGDISDEPNPHATSISNNGSLRYV